MRYLVTGATGFIGSRLVRELVDAGHDLAHAHVLAMKRDRPGESYNVAGQPTCLVQALGIAESLTGIPAPRLRMPPVDGLATAFLVRPFERILPLPETYTDEVLRSSAGVTYLGSNEKARAELGYDPRPLDKGLRPTLRREMERLRMTPPPSL